MRQFNASFEPTPGCLYGQRRLSVFLVLGALGAFLFQPATVNATCGDHLIQGLLLSEFDTQFDLDSVTPSTWTDGPFRTRGAEPLPYRKRCTGPSCQQSPSQSPLSSHVVTDSPQDRRADEFHLNVASPLRAKLGVPQSDSVCLLILTFRLDRPPKLLSR